jgi:hypothetical protein
MGRELAIIDREIDAWGDRLQHTVKDREAWGDGYDSRMAAIYAQLAALWAERADVHGR